MTWHAIAHRENQQHFAETATPLGPGEDREVNTRRI